MSDVLDRATDLVVDVPTPAVGRTGWVEGAVDLTGSTTMGRRRRQLALLAVVAVAVSAVLAWWRRGGDG